MFQIENLKKFEESVQRGGLSCAHITKIKLTQVNEKIAHILCCSYYYCVMVSLNRQKRSSENLKKDCFVLRKRSNINSDKMNFR